MEFTHHAVQRCTQRGIRVQQVDGYAAMEYAF